MNADDYTTETVNDANGLAFRSSNSQPRSNRFFIKLLTSNQKITRSNESTLIQIESFKISYRYRMLLLLFLLIFSIQVTYLINNFNSNRTISSLSSFNLSQKYIRYECVIHGICGGWADRLKGIFSAYALSLILNRNFLIEITQPCYITSVLQPNQVNWDEGLQLEIQRLKPDYKQRKLHFLWDFSSYKYFETTNLIEELGEYDLVTVRLGRMNFESLSKNPFVQQRIHELGYNASRFRLHYLLHDFYHKMFKLNDKLQRKYEELLKKLKPATSSKLICAQIRIGGDIDLSFGSRNSSLEFWKFIDQYKANNKIDSNYVIFVTSDKDYVKKEAEAHFAKDHVVTMDNSSIHIDLDVLNLQDDCSLIENVIVEFHLLQHCDVAIVSHSGFGLLGAFNRRVPNQELYVFTNQNVIKREYWNRSNLTFIKVENLDDFFYT